MALDPVDLLVAVGVILFIAEFRMAAWWSPAYWFSGLVVFRSRSAAAAPTAPPPTPEGLQLRFTSQDYFGLDFWPIGHDCYAFADDPTCRKFRLPSVMHGHLEFDRQQGTVEVVGLLNYFTLLIGAALLVLGFRLWPLLVIGAAILFLCYLMQTHRYEHVMKASAAEWVRRS